MKMLPALLAVLTLGAALCVAGDPPPNRENPVPPAATEKSAIPPIDAEAPAKVSTATFAVG